MADLRTAGKVTVGGKVGGDVISGFALEGYSAAQVRGALASMPGFTAGDVEVAGDVEGDVVTGVRVAVREAPTQAEFIAALRDLHARLVAIESGAGMPAEVAAAAKALEDAAAEAGKPPPITKVVGDRLKEAAEMLGDADKAVESTGSLMESAGKVAEMVKDALPQVLWLMAAASKLYGI